MTKIIQTASFLPEKIITNNDLAKYLETNDEWITSRTGIKERRKAEELTTSEMAIEVAKKLVAKNQEPLDFIIVATFTPEVSMPSMASLVQGAIGAKAAFAFDVNAACGGFVYAMNIAHHLLKGEAKRGMVIGAEKTSYVVDAFDRKTAVLFGDGAGGVLLEKSDQLFVASLRNDGTRSQALTAGFKDNHHKLTMDGKEIFSFVLRDVFKNIAEVIETSPYEKEEVDYFLLHQANQRLLIKLATKLQVSTVKFLSNVKKYGNTSAASIPILLDEAVSEKKIQLGEKQKILLSGFGGGLSFGTILMES